jgi:hypothetical protein
MEPPRWATGMSHIVVYRLVRPRRMRGELAVDTVGLIA